MISNDSVILRNKLRNFNFLTIGEAQQPSELRRMTGFKAGKGIAIIKPHHLAYSKNKHKETSLKILHSHPVHSRA